ncbi:MAG: immunoglobulin domain-containing protein [Phycisphaerales bacterium]|jgi:hypothetical protein
MTPSPRGVFFSRIARVRSLSLALGLLTMAFAATNARAQGSCDGTWVPTMGPSGVDGTVYAMAKWDPDGPGPLPEGVLMGGSFAVAGNVVANNIAWWNPQTKDFTALGGGVNGKITTIAIMPDGRVIAGGDFSAAGGSPVRHIAAWDGVHWLSLGTGIDNNTTGTTVINSLAVFNNLLLVAGNFRSAGGVNTGAVAGWEGQSWSAFGSVAGSATGLATDPTTGELSLVADGSLFSWSEGEWQLRDLARFYSGPMFYDANSVLFACGVSGFPAILRWNPQGVSSVLGGQSSFTTVLVTDTGHLCTSTTSYGAVGFYFWPKLRLDIAGTVYSYPMSNDVLCLLQPSADVILAGGAFTASGLNTSARNPSPQFYPLIPTGQPAQFSNGALRPLRDLGATFFPSIIARLSDGAMAAVDTDHSRVYVSQTGDGWTDLPFDRPPFEAGYVNDISAIAALNNGAMAAIQADRIYYRTASDSWTFIGAIGGTAPMYHSLFDASMLGLPNGDLVVASPSLSSINDQPVHYLARWNGQAWLDMCSSMTWRQGTTDYHIDLGTASNGDLLVCADIVSIDGVPVNGIARWDGTSWHAMGDLNLANHITLCSLPSGRIVASGNPLGDPGSFIRQVREWRNGDWETATQVSDSGFYVYTQYPSRQFIGSVICRDNGDIIVGAKFTSIGGIAANNIARWDGAAWHPIGDGLPGERVSAVLPSPDGGFYAAGQFSHSGNTVSYGIAHAIFTGNPPAITQQPPDTTTCVGYGAAFHVAASGEGSLSFRWSINGSAIDTAANPSAASDTLVLASNAPFGNYRCTITNGCGSITTDPATLSLAACCPDYNLDGNADAADIDTLFALMGGGDNPNAIDPDFNHDGNTDQDDIDALINVVAGGDCP